MYPNINSSLFKNGLSFLKSIDFASILDGTSKTLGVINQAIPVYYQVKPILSNFHTLKNIQNIIKEDEPDETSSTNPIFYI